MKELPEIRILSDDIANKIAAGEVIERPAAVVKELVENSIDAKADKIDIEFKNGGKSFIKISDNGHGMRRDQVLACLEAHATSKIRTADDLETVLSFGFRGEAVPSIASVSKFTLLSKPEEAVVGTRADIYSGEIKDVRECAMARGTEVIVENLFCSVPARRKFLKSDNTESTHIIKICKLYALAKPNVEFSLTEDGREVFKSQKTSGLIARVENIFGLDIASKIIPLIPYESYGISVSGALSKPSEAWVSARNIYAFINGRPIESRAVYSALKEAYQNAMPQGKYPAAFIFIEIDPRLVDVNVHPAKREVRLKSESTLRGAILASAIETIEKYSISSRQNIDPTQEIKLPNSPEFKSQESYFSNAPLGYSNSQEQTFKNDEQSLQAQEILRKIAEKNSESRALQMSPPLRMRLQTPQNVEAINEANTSSNIQKIEINYSRSDSRPSSALGWKYLKHLSKKYALFETQSASLIILSIPSALKRINYDKIARNFAGTQPQSQRLLIPINVEFDRADDEIFKKNIKSFETCGFEIEEFGERFYRICAAPLWIEFGDIESFIKDFTEIAKEEGRTLAHKSLSEQNFANLAIKMARGTRLIESEHAANSLLEELFECKSPMFSPDGRRTCKEITQAELSSFFGE